MAGTLRTPKNASVAKAFQILDVLSSAAREMTATDVAQTLGSNLPTVHRFLVTLEELGAVSRTAQGQFQVGLMLANLGGKVESHKLLIEQVQPQLVALATELREVAHCAVLNGSMAVNVARALPDRALIIGHATGTALPLYCSAVGKVLLASMGLPERERLLQHAVLEKHTEHTITDAKVLSLQLRDVATQGYAVDNEEWEEGLRSIAMPVRNKRKQTVAAIGMSAPASRLDDATLSLVRSALQRAVNQAEHAMFSESRVFPQKARPRGAFPHLKRVDNFIFVSGTSARKPDDSFEGVKILPDGTVQVDIRKQTRAVFQNIRDMLTGVGCALDNLVDIHAYLTDMRDYEGFNEAYAEFFDYDGPTRTTVGVSELPHPHQRLMIRAVAFAPHSQFGEEPAG